jgi:4-diphosphocytidyl-2-C-methyl-D-erythritol kinase
MTSDAPFLPDPPGSPDPPSPPSTPTPGPSAPLTWSGSAPAKVNLFLRVLAREEGGYHQIETLFQALELADRVGLQISWEEEPGGIALQLEGVEEGALGPSGENLVVRAARAFLEAAAPSFEGRPPGVAIHLTKRIPHGAGLGGGSSDAAAVLRGLAALLPERVSPSHLQALAGRLGADVPFFLADTPLALGWGRGDQLLPLPPLPPRELLLLVPPEGISTPWAYAELAAHRSRAGSGPPPARILGAGLVGDPGDTMVRWGQVTALAENAFQAALQPHRPDLEEIRRALEGVGASPALLSGSGSALFGVFATPGEADAAEEALARRLPGVGRIRTRTRS